MGAFQGNFGVLVRAFAYIRTLGKEGIRAISDDAVVNANYILAKLRGYYDLPFDRLCMHEVVLSARNLKNEFNVSALDVRGLTSFTDAFVLITGTSDRHVRSVADAILEGIRSLNKERLGIEGYDEGRWILIDLNEVVTHIFQENVREEYDLERLWSDAVPITLENADI